MRHHLGVIDGPIASAPWTLVVPVLFWAMPLAFFVWWKRNRDLQLRRLGRRLGLEYRGAPHGIEHLPRMLRQQATASLSGTWREHRVTYVHAGALSAASVDVPADCPRLVIDGRHGADRIWGGSIAPVSLTERRGTEWEEFDRGFDVRCDDARFANAFVDQRMMRALMGFADGHSYIEVRGDTLTLTSTRAIPVSEVEALLDRLTALADQIPRIIPEMYGPRP